MTALPTRIDVAIMGGGFAGCATAWALASRGIRSVVLEREPELGRYASGRGAGLGRQLAEDDHTTTLTIRGAELLRAHFPELWLPTGGVLGFDDPNHARSYVERAARFGVAHAEISAEAVRGMWPVLDRLAVSAAIQVQGDGVIDVRGLLDRLAERVEPVRGAEVTRIEEGEVTTTRGTISARVVVDASGAWAGQLTGDPPLEAYRRHLFVLEAAAAVDTPFLWHLGHEELYVRPDRRGVLASACDGAVSAPGDHQVTAEGEAGLRARLREAAPGWAEIPLVAGWACQRSFAPDRRMRLGRDPHRSWLVWAAALGGHGATAALAVGEAVAAEVCRAL